MQVSGVLQSETILVNVCAFPLSYYKLFIYNFLFVSKNRRVADSSTLLLIVGF